MKKILIFLLLPMCLWAFSIKEYKSTLVKAGPKYGYIKDNPKIELNSGGIVIKKIGKFETIVARVKVVAKKDNLAKLEFKVFRALAQRAMPTPIIMPSKNDEVILNYLYDRVVIIAPNKASYRFVKDELSFAHIVNVDLLAAFLIDNYSKRVSRKLLRSFCRQNAVGVAAFVLRKQAYLYDCLLFSKLDTIKTKFWPTQQRPFYSHIKTTRGAIFNFFDDSMGDYYYYYKQLLSY